MNTQDQQSEVIDLGAVTTETRGSSVPSRPDDNLIGFRPPLDGIADE